MYKRVDGELPTPHEAKADRRKHVGLSTATHTKLCGFGSCIVRTIPGSGLATAQPADQGISFAISALGIRTQKKTWELGLVQAHLR
jgi:hypothetical protein